MPIVLTLLAIVVLALIVLYVARTKVSAREQITEELKSDATPTLEYDVPTGQDPAVILAALDQAGYTASVDPALPQQIVLISCPGGVDRERARVRSVIQSAQVTTQQDGVPLQVDVRFRDE